MISYDPKESTKKLTEKIIRLYDTRSIYKNQLKFPVSNEQYS